MVWVDKLYLNSSMEKDDEFSRSLDDEIPMQEDFDEPFFGDNDDQYELWIRDEDEKPIKNDDIRQEDFKSCQHNSPKRLSPNKDYSKFKPNSKRKKKKNNKSNEETGKKVKKFSSFKTNTTNGISKSNAVRKSNISKQMSLKNKTEKSKLIFK